MDTSDRPADPQRPDHEVDDPGLDFDQPVAVIPVSGYEPPPGQPPSEYAAPSGYEPPADLGYVPSPGFGYEPPPPRKVGPPRSVVGAALLNVTGLGLGYAYLRNRGLLVVALVGTVALVTAALLTDAAARPWLWRGLMLSWLVALGAHAALLASRREPGAAQRTPVLAGVAAVAVVVAGYVGYGLAGAGAYDRGVAAQADGDCPTATDEFDSVTGPYKLTFSADIAEAERRADECAAYEKAMAAQKRGDFTAAILLYEKLRQDDPDSPLAPYVHTNLADSHFAKATSWRSPVSSVDVEVSVNTLLMLSREFADTEPAKKVPGAIADMFTEATKPYGEGKFCDALPALTFFAALDPSSVGARIAADANTFRARSLYECGLSQAHANDYPTAVTTLETFVAAYPNDGGIPQAKAALITAKVAVAAQVRLPFPPPLGDNDPGSNPVTFYNDSSSPVTIYVAGPTAHEIVLPACPTCPVTYPKDDPAACRDMTGRPSVTLHLPSNTYYYTTAGDRWTRQVTDTFTTRAGYVYSQCLYASPD
jgi:tetratricopeptide (TPR) repeat protein